MEIAIIAAALSKLYDLVVKDPVTDHYRPFKDYTSNLRKLESNLSAIQATLKSGQLQRITDPNLLDWLRKLKEAAFDADDVLDAIASEALIRLLDSSSRWCSISKPCHIFFRYRVGYKVWRLLEDLQDIAKERGFHLRVGDPTDPKDDAQRSTHSFVPPDSLVGREGDKAAVSSLLADGTGEAGLGVVAIHGLPGSGKTTLARTVYNEFEGEGQFMKIWVFVGQDFSLRRIAKGVLEGMERRLELAELEGVKISLEKAVRGKKLLLVLDDVWNERQEAWIEVEGILKREAPGSKLLVTTRSERVATVMGARVHRLKTMSDEDCWLLIEKRAFRPAGPEASESLASIGRQIAGKCGGLPLVAIVLGGLLFHKTDELQWQEVLDNEIWDCLPDAQEDEREISPALRLSYSQLPLRSKPCFAYLAIFPKGRDLDKGRVVEQWIANGFIAPRGRRRLKLIGEEIFDDLLARGLLLAQDPDAAGYRMHDMVHDLASFIVRRECHILREVGGEDRRNIRFLSLCVNPSQEILQELRGVRKCRTLLVSTTPDPGSVDARFLGAVFRNLKFLRALDVSSCGGITDVPKTIKDLVHLRYLDFSDTGITGLPAEMRYLVNLTTLRLRNCQIREWPEGVKTPPYLDVRGSPLEGRQLANGEEAAPANERTCFANFCLRLRPYSCC